MSDTTKDFIEYAICWAAILVYLVVQPNIVTGVLL